MTSEPPCTNNSSPDRSALQQWRPLSVSAFSTAHRYHKHLKEQWNPVGKAVDVDARLYVSAAGANAYGPNQCANDNDGTVDQGERLKVNVPAGKSDVKLAFDDGKVCIVRNVEIVAGGVFSIEDKDLTSCSK